MTRLDARVEPRHYRLDLDIDPKKERFSGRVEITIDAPVGRRAIELHAVDLAVEDASAEDARGALPVTGLRANARRETLRVRLGRGTEGPVVLRMGYTGPLRDDLRGLYLARSGRRRYAATQLEAADARRMFPCFDEPDKKARFEVVVTTPKKNDVVANAPVADEQVKGTKKTVRFRTTPKLSTYLVALVVGELEASKARRSGKTPIRVWHVPGKAHLTAFALEAAVASLERLERYFGLPYPYEKLDLIAVPDFEFGAMENAGAVTFRESLLLTDPDTVTLPEQKRVAEVVAHELAHMWFGDLVTMAWWDDLWLNEAFATWMAFSVVDDWKPEWQMWLDFQHHRAAAFRLDGLRNTHPIYTTVATPDEATENFDAITYEKGASVVRMVERWLGPAAFRRGVRKYIRRHREANARAADLWNALEEASGQPVAPVVRAWIERPGFPLVSVRRVRRRGDDSLAVAQERFFAQPRGLALERRARWPIPLVVRVRPMRGRAKTVRALVEKERAHVPLETSDPRWVYANADEGGFYRPLHDEELLSALGERLSELSAAERMGLVGHQWAGVRGHRAPLADLLGLAERLGGEERPEVLEALLGPLAWLHDHAVPRLVERGRQRFQRWIREQFGPAFADLGFDAGKREPDDARLRRAALLRIVGGIGEDEAVRAECGRRVRAYLRDRSTLDANLAGPVVELAARIGDKTRYERYLATMRRARTPQERTRFELALASFTDPALVARTLELALSEDVPTQDVVPLLLRLLANPDGRDATWVFIRDRWDELSPRVSTGLAARLVSGLSALQTPAHKKEVAAFFKAHPIPSAARALKQTLETFTNDAALRRRTVPELRRFLRDRFLEKERA